MFHRAKNPFSKLLISQSYWVFEDVTTFHYQMKNKQVFLKEAQNIP